MPNTTITTMLQLATTIFLSNSKQNALTIQHSITNARQKDMHNGSHVKHGYSNNFLTLIELQMYYVCFTSDTVAVTSSLSVL